MGLGPQRMRSGDSDDTGRKRPGFSEEGIHHMEGVKTENDQMVSLLNGKVWFNITQ